MQDLYYNTVSSSVTLTKQGSLDVTWENITEVRVLTSSLYWNGEDYSNQILLISGSDVLAYFPISNTNLFYTDYLPLNNPYVTSSVIYTTLLFKFDNTYSNTGSYNIYDSSSAFYYVSESGNSNEGGLSIISGNNHQVYLISSGSYETLLTIRNTSSGSILANISSSDIPVSSSFIPSPYCNYEVTFSLGPPPS